MAVASALRLASHGPAVAAATAAAVATASIATEIPDLIAGTNPAEAMLVYPAHQAKSVADGFFSYHQSNGNYTNSNRIHQILSTAASPSPLASGRANLCSPRRICPHCGSCSAVCLPTSSPSSSPSSSHLSSSSHAGGPHLGLCLDTQQAYLRILCSPHRSSSHHLLRSHAALASTSSPRFILSSPITRSALSFAPLTLSQTLMREVACAADAAPSSSSSSGITDNIFGFFDPFAFSSLARSSPLASQGGAGASHCLASRSLHAWHSPAPGSFRGVSEGDVSQGGQKARPSTTVILLGWLGAQQRHLRRIAEWYNSQGIHAVTFVIPMSTILGIGMNGRAEETVDHLVDEIARWVRAHQPENGHHVGPERSLVFHTFSNTGWLTYGAVLDRLMKRGDDLIHNIKGCIVDSAPVPDPDPHVFASGFAAAFLKKRSVAAQMGVRVPVPKADGQSETDKATSSTSPKAEGSAEAMEHVFEKPEADPTEKALQAMLAKLFAVVLQMPVIKSKLSEVTTILAKRQPPCPQLYIYSTTDTVIPASSVESFMEEQRKGGRVVMGTRMEGSPHVDHFRTSPQIYTSHITNFLKHCIPHWDAPPSQGGNDHQGLHMKSSSLKDLAQT